LAKYLACERLSDVRRAIRACRDSETPREQHSARALAIRKPGLASLMDQKRLLLGDLVKELAEAVKRYWLTRDNSADWERVVQGEQQSARTLKSEAATESDASHATTIVADRDATPLSLRGRFREQMSLMFTSDVLRQIQYLLESRDNRGRPLISSSDAKLIADTARTVISSLAMCTQPNSNGASRITDAPALGTLVATGSRRLLSRAIETFDFKQPERFLAADAIDDLIKSECQALLEDSLTQPELAAAIDARVELDQLCSRTLDRATSDLLQCGSDRRTLLCVPKSAAQGVTVDKLREVRPLAAVVPANVDDVLVISEEAAISPRSLALGLERVFPGIADAARRLQSRIDVEWQRLI
jgi:hypothetical protein